MGWKSGVESEVWSWLKNKTKICVYMFFIYFYFYFSFSWQRRVAFGLVERGKRPPGRWIRGIGTNFTRDSSLPCPCPGPLRLHPVDVSIEQLAEARRSEERRGRVTVQLVSVDGVLFHGWIPATNTRYRETSTSLGESRTPLDKRFTEERNKKKEIENAPIK